METTKTGRPTRSPTADVLPPGQFEVDGFPRFGTHFHRPPPPIPDQPSLAIGGEVGTEISVPLGDLFRSGRQEMAADFHCVAGWSAKGLSWEGIAFSILYSRTIEPALVEGTTPTHLSFIGLDGYRSVVELRDALNEEVMLVDRLDGAPLSSDHGAPLRLVSPSQYGYMSTKHLCRIEVHSSRPAVPNPAAVRVGRWTFRTPLIDVHPRARVWQEERHPRLPSWSLRHFYRLLVGPIRALSARGSCEADGG